MLLAVLPLFLRAADDSPVYSFVATETARLYTFRCNESLRVRHPSLDPLTLLVRASLPDIKCTKTNLATGEAGPLPLQFAARGDGAGRYQEARAPALGGDCAPFELAFECTAPSPDCAAVALLAEQSATGRPAIIALGVVAIILAALTLAIIGVQFLTFHRKKHE
jgi:hypothetical protein